MKNPKVAVICVFNDEYTLKTQLIKSLEQQDIEYYPVFVDNRNNFFDCAAKALNHAAKATEADILVFSHQDVYLKEKNGLSQFVSCVQKGDIGNIYGSSGAVEIQRENVGAYTTGNAYNDSRIQGIKEQEVSCVDECFFGMKKETFQNHGFNEEICDNWHLYCVEMCLFARSKGKKVIMYPIQIHHFSRGTITVQYMEGLKKLSKEYRGCFKYIWTTAYKVRTNPVYLNFLVTAWKINRKCFKPLFRKP